MNDLIIYYILGGLISSGIITIWNFSHISVHLLSWIYKDREIHSLNDLGDAIAEKHPTLSELLFCPTCLGFWVAILVATAITLLNGFSYWFIPSAAFSWPLFILLAFKHFRRK